MPLLEEQDPAALLEAAAATLDLSEPEAALGYLSALDSLPATAVRRRALVALGSNSESQDESVSSDNLAWSLGDWRTAAAVDDGPFQALANLMVGGPAAVSDRVVATADVQSSENTTSVAGAGDSPDSADAAGANTLAAARITISIAQTAKKVMEAALESTILD